MNLFEKLNLLDDSLVESKRVVKKKKLTQSVEDETEDVYDDDIDEEYNSKEDEEDEMLTESTEQYELSTLVKDSINHLVNDLGKDPMADDFGDDVCDDLENNYDIDVPQDMVRYADWCNAVMSEVSRQLNKVEEQLTENRWSPYFTPYGYKDAAKVLNGKAPEYYYHLKEIEMDRGDGIKLARYALKKGLPVMVNEKSDPDYPEFAIKGNYHWENSYFYPYPTAHEDELIPWDGKMFVEEQLTEGNNVSSQLTPAIDAFLQDIAQMYETIDYKDIMKHNYSEEDIRKLKNLRRKFRAEVPYEGDEEADAILQEIAKKVAKIVKD